MTAKPATLTRRSPVAKRAPVILERLHAAYPDAHVALDFTSPLECLIATILSAQCTDARVNMVTKDLFKKYKTPQDYLDVSEDEFKDDIRSTGFFNQKTASIRGACRRIVEAYGGEVPSTMEDLITLPGVARKTANIVMGNAFGKVEGIAVDTHVRRVSNKLGFSDTQDTDKIELDLMRLIPKKKWFDFSYVIIDHGRAICHAKKPQCADCVVNDLCPSSLV